MKAAQLGMILVFAMAAAQMAPAADAPSTAPSAPNPAITKLVDDSLSKLADGSDDEKQLAEDRLFNAPLSAFALIEAGLKRPGLDAESRQRLVRVVDHLRPIVKVRTAADAVREKDFEWNQRTALEAYDHAGRHDPKWDDLAREAIRQFTSRLTADRAAAFVTLEHVTSDLKCDDPLVLYMDARDLEDAAAHEADLAKRGMRLGQAINTYGASCEKFEKSFNTHTDRWHCSRRRAWRQSLPGPAPA